MSSELPSRDELLRQCRELQVIVDAMPACVCYKDTSNAVLRMNRAAADLVRACEGRWSPDSQQQFCADLEVVSSGQPKLGVLESIDVPGLGARWFETARLPQFDAKGRIFGLVVIWQDITDRKQLEENQLQGQKLESIGRLAGGVAHDFNNLLTSIFGLIALAQRELPGGSPAHEYLALLRLAAEGGANLTKQLLAFARRQMIEPQLVDLNALVLETSSLLERVLGENIELHVALSSQALPVKVDPNQISQLIMNLALNARDAMPEGGTLTFRTASSALELAGGPDAAAGGTGNWALLSISDTGMGLTAEAREHLFEPFFTTKALGKGTGLGLAMCYGIVKQNRGHIDVQSELGRGTTFTVYLPELEAPVSTPRRQEVMRTTVEPGQETVLFVEDDDLVRSMAVTELAAHGYRVIEAADGEEALKAAVEHNGPIHLLVTDVIMPKMGGVELAKKLSQIRPGLPVLFISGYADEALNDSLPRPPLLLKPFANDVLLSRVQQLLDGRQHEASLRPS